MAILFLGAFKAAYMKTLLVQLQINSLTIWSEMYVSFIFIIISCCKAKCNLWFWYVRHYYNYYYYWLYFCIVKYWTAVYVMTSHYDSSSTEILRYHTAWLNTTSLNTVLLYRNTVYLHLFLASKTLKTEQSQKEKHQFSLVRGHILRGQKSERSGTTALD